MISRLFTRAINHIYTVIWMVNKLQTPSMRLFPSYVLQVCPSIIIVDIPSQLATGALACNAFCQHFISTQWKGRQVNFKHTNPKLSNPSIFLRWMCNISVNCQGPIYVFTCKFITKICLMDPLFLSNQCQNTFSSIEYMDDWMHNNV